MDGDALPRAPTAAATVPRTSAMFMELARRHQGEAVGIGEIVDGLRERAFGLVFILLALGNVVPLPPGVGGAFGLVIVGFALQLLCGGAHPWLPRSLRRLAIRRDRLLALLIRAAPKVRWLEAWCRPRLTSMTRRRVERLLGLPIALLGLLMALPLPLTGTPPAVATILIALGILERDGVMVIFGLAGSVAALVLVGIAAGAYAVGLAALAGQLMGG